MKKINTLLLSSLLTSSVLPAYGFNLLQPANTQDLVIANSDKLSLKRKIIRISPKVFKVEEEFFNESDKDIEALVSFYVPSYHCTNPFYVRPPEEAEVTPEGVAILSIVPKRIAQDREFFKFLRFADLKVSVNGNPVKIFTEMKAKAEGGDITDELKKLGMAHINCTDIGNLKPSILKTLKERQLIRGDATDWSMYNRHYWTVLFPAKKTTKLEHSFAPRSGLHSEHLDGKVLYDELFAWTEKNGKSSATFAGHLLARTEESGLKKASEDFELIIEGAPLVWSYFEGNLYYGIGKIHIKKQDYIPTDDLTFAFAKPNADIPKQFHEKLTANGPSNLVLNPEGKVLLTIPDKTVVEVFDYVNGWFRTQYQGKIGFVNEKNLDLISILKKPKYFMSKNTAPGCGPSSLPFLKIISPNGGETFQGGQKVLVKWQSCNLSPTVSLDLAWSHPQGDGGTGQGDVPNNGDYEFTLPVLDQYLSEATGFSFRVGGSRAAYNRRDYKGTEDKSDSPFKLVKKSVRK